MVVTKAKYLKTGVRSDTSPVQGRTRTLTEKAARTKLLSLHYYIKSHGPSYRPMIE